jgi:hypothetical protein
MGKAIKKSDTLASRRRVLFVHGECGRTSLSVTHRTGRKRRLPRGQAFAIWAPHTSQGLSQWPSPRPCIQNLRILYLIWNHCFARVEHTPIPCPLRRPFNQYQHSGKRKTSSPLRDVVAINGPPFRHEALCATVCECSSWYQGVKSIRQLEYSQPPPPTKNRTRGARVVGFHLARWSARAGLLLPRRVASLPPGEHDVRKNNGRCLFT